MELIRIILHAQTNTYILLIIDVSFYMHMNIFTTWYYIIPYDKIVMHHTKKLYDAVDIVFHLISNLRV